MLSSSEKLFWTGTFQTSRNPTCLKFLCSRPCTWTTIQMSHEQNEIKWHQEQHVFGRFQPVSTFFNLFQPFSTRVNSHEELDLGLPKNESSNGLSLRKDLEIIPWLQFPCGPRVPKTKTNQKRWVPGSAGAAAAGPFAGPLPPFLGEPSVSTPRCVMVWVMLWVITMATEMTSAEWWVWVPRSI